MAESRRSLRRSKAASSRRGDAEGSDLALVRPRQKILPEQYRCLTVCPKHERRSSLDSMFPLLPFQLIHSRTNVVFCICLHFFGLVVQYHQVTIHEVEAVELVTGLLRVHYVFVDHKGCSFGLVVRTGADLADGTELAEEVEQSGGVDVVCEILYEEDAVRFRSEFVGAGHVSASELALVKEFDRCRV